MIKLVSHRSVFLAIVSLILIAKITVFAQKQGQERVDSIEYRILKNDLQDTNRVNSLCEISFAYFNINPEKGIAAGQQALQLAEKLNFISGQAKANRFIGVNYYGLSDYANALKHYQKALEAERENGNKKGMGSNLMNIGLIYYNQANFSKALDYFFKSIRIFEEINFQKGLSTCYGNIVLVYTDLGEIDKALEFAFKANDIDKEMGNLIGQAKHIQSIGVLYMKKKARDKALHYSNEALKMFEKAKDDRSIANTLANIAGIYIENKDFDTALNYIKQSNEKYQALNSKKEVAINLKNLSTVYIEMYKSKYLSKIVPKKENLLKLAEENAQKALLIAIDLNQIDVERDCRLEFYEIEKIRGNYAKALTAYEKYVVLRDSINGQENKKEIVRKELMFEFEKKTDQDSIRNASEKQLQQAQIEAQQAKLNNERTKRYVLIVGLVMLVILSLFINSRLRIMRKQKFIIEKQKDFLEKQRDSIALQKSILEEKNKEIFDSIVYAKRLQEAILPSKKLINSYFPNYYVYYQPKDIVAGDFYWLDTFPKDEAGNFLKPADTQIDPSQCVYFAVADCTGHGVPGAMISIFCSNALNRAVNEFYLIDPGKILDKVRDLVIETFAKSEIEVSDGMDISLCVFDFKTYNLYWAGANNPLWIVRNQEMFEYKPNRQPVGKYDKPTNFDTHQIQLQKGDKFYIFTDGLADQFGGDKGKKLKVKHLRELILAHQSNSMVTQVEMMERFFTMWKGHYEQIDDVCIIGVAV
jgi:serine phosphatase RsbU (regulator of sigma subunit)